MTEPLLRCACGQPATALARDGHETPLCDDCQEPRRPYGWGAPLDQAKTLPWSSGRLRWLRDRVAQSNEHGAWDRTARWFVTLDVATAERDEARRQLEAELNPQFLCDDMRDMACRLGLGPVGTSHEIDVRIDDLLKAEAERDVLRAAVLAFCANASVCMMSDCKAHPHDWRTLAAALPASMRASLEDEPEDEAP